MNPLDELSSAIKATLLISTLPSLPTPPSPAITIAAPAVENVNANKGKGKKGKAVKQQTQTKPSTTSSNNNKNSKAVSTTTTTPSSYDRWTIRDESTIEYGCFGGRQTTTTPPLPTTTTTTDDKPFYITTAINYANGPAHIGHAYEAATSDAIARYQRINRNDYDTNTTTTSNKKILFVTGADEHGQKIATTAETEGVQPIELCNRYVNGFKVLNQRLLITPDDYIRTTSDRHKATARALWSRCASTTSTTTDDGKQQSDIYLSTYSGWYNIREETFVTDSDAELTNFLDPETDLPLKKVEEESYFFRMSSYHDRLVQHIESNPEFIQPTWHRNQVMARLKKDQLRDLSISRTTFDWGIDVPQDLKTNAKHVMYVWFDALTNYLTAVDGMNLSPDKCSEVHKFWPAAVHIIGKDISWFHTVIWPTILLSAGLPLPTTIYAHGFVNDSTGKKMSKSIGNIVNPHDMLDLYTVDTFRWYLCREAPYGGDLSFKEGALIERHNADLCDTVGNLIHRATNLCGKYCDGVVPDVGVDTTVLTTTSKLVWKDVVSEYQTKMNAYELEGGAGVVMKGFRDVNGYLTERAPWLIKGKGVEQVEERKVVVRATLEAVYALSILLLPFIPVGASEIFRKLGMPPKGLGDVDGQLRNLVPGTKVVVGDVLYSKVGGEEDGAEELTNKANKAVSHAESKERKRLEKAKSNEASKAGQKGGKKNAAADVNQPEFTKMDIRVGLVTKVWNHPDADKLFCEEVDVGEESGGTRQITSGLRGHYELEEFQGKKVLVVCNLKASKLVGFVSNGMVLAAKSADGSKVELITPPDDAPIGERVFIDGLEGNPFSPAQVKKKKTWDAVAKELKTGAGSVAMWSGKEIMTSVGKCAAASLVGVPFS